MGGIGGRRKTSLSSYDKPLMKIFLPNTLKLKYAPDKNREPGHVSVCTPLILLRIHYLHPPLQEYLHLYIHQTPTKE